MTSWISLMKLDNFIALVALVVSIIALLVSIFFWRRSFRPIISVKVKTNTAGNARILYDLVIVNSGQLPARDIRIEASEADLENAFGVAASEERKSQVLSCFNSPIEVLQNGDKTSGEFGDTAANDTGFWKYGSRISVTVRYRGWFGTPYVEFQNLKVADTTSFTPHHWG
jgi:hypothetical protein